MDQQGLRVREQKATSLNELLLAIQSKYEQIALEGSFPVSNGRILSRAVAPTSAASPKAWQLLSAALAIGGLLGLALAVLRESRETGFRTGQDLREAADVAFLGYLPVLRRRNVRLKPGTELTASNVEPAAMPSFVSARGSKGSVGNAHYLVNPIAKSDLTVVAPVQMDKLPSDLFVSANAPGTRADNLLRNVLATIDLGYEAHTARVVAVGAVTDGEGATSVAVNLANLAALSGHRTLLIDGDLQSSALPRRLGCPDQPGTLDVLDGSVDIDRAIRKLPCSGLDFLASGAPDKSGRAYEATCLPRFSELIYSLRANYDYVFIDLPPLGNRPEAKSLLKSYDRIILVTRWGKTPRRLVQTYLANEPEVHRRILGAILARTRLRKLRYYGVPSGL
jgi:Mrp family chromosome partitioning ATPase